MQVSVNETVISDQQINREVQYHPAASLEEARKEAARALVVRELLLQEAQRRGFEQLPEDGDEEPRDELLIRKLLDSEISIPGADEESCRRYYENNPDRFRTPTRHHVAHIFFPAPPQDAEARARASARAKQSCEELLNDPEGPTPERFARMARERSSCSSAPDGGSLGWIGPGQTTPEIEMALAEMTPGELRPQPVTTRYGCHVLLLLDRAEGEQLSFEQARPRIAEYLQDQARNRAVRQFILILAGQADVRGLDMEASGTPLVQ